ncbi:MAG: hypothetical protein GY827_11640 [Cytophagales bacterium]|nr:hypothetical protein [Cytophagales bacterium]
MSKYQLPIKVTTLTFLNLIRFGKMLIFIGFGIYCAIDFQFTGENNILDFILSFIYITSVILTAKLIHYFSERLILDKTGITHKNIISTKYIQWKNVQSVEVKLIINEKHVEVLEEKDYYQDHSVGTKEITIIDQYKTKIRIPYREEIVSLLKEQTILP